MTDAGELDQRYAFAKKGSASDGYGGTTTAYVDQFTVWAGVTHLRGGETVMAGRLQGKHPQVVRIRSSSQSRQITTDWRARDTKTGTVFAIRDITPTSDRLFLDVLCESGVAP